MERNNITFQELVNGDYGRKVAYTDVERITEENIVRVVGEAIGVHNRNRQAIRYLWRYLKGDQPALYRVNTARDDVNNKVVENRAYEIVQFKNGQTNGEPIQAYSLKEDDNINKAVDKFNDYCRAAHKHSVDVSSGEWTSAVGTGFKAVQRKQGDVPFRYVMPSPMNTFAIYSRSTGEEMLYCQELKDDKGENYILCFDETMEYRIKNGALMETLDTNGQMVKSKPHGFGDFPIREYPNNQNRLSDIELVISCLDAINEMQSDRVDSIQQFVQSWVKFVNVDIDSETFEKMKMEGALVVKSNNGENKADVDILSNELDQGGGQTLKEDMWNSTLSILGIPNKERNTGGDTQGAVQLRNGWDFAKSRAKLKDPYTVKPEKQLAMVALNINRQANGDSDCPLKEMDFDVKVDHSPQDNMQVKAQVYQMLVQCGIHPLIAMKTCGLWGDAEKTYLLSKPYLDVLYKTIDQIEDKEEQERKAQELIAQYENGETQDTARGVLSSNGTTQSREEEKGTNSQRP